MENINIWMIYFITLIGYSLAGVYIYWKKRLRAKVNMKEIWQLFGIVTLFRVFDVLSTIYFTNKLGIEYEGNLIARAFMMQYGIIPGILTISLLTIPLMFFWFVLMNYIFGQTKKGIGWKIFKVLIIMISAIVPIINLSV
jgi:hypothetical protein